MPPVKPNTDPGDEQPVDLEGQAQEAWLLMMFLSLGFSPIDAHDLASVGADWHEAGELIAAGCPTRLAKRISMPL